MSFVNIAVPSIQGALFQEKSEKKIKVYGRESAVIMSGSIQAADKKEGDKYVPLAYGRLAVQAAKAETKDGKEYLFLSIEGGLQGHLHKADPGQDYDYAGSIDAGDGTEFVVFGRRRKSEGGVSFISLNSAERKAKKSAPAKAAAATAPAPANDFDDDIPF